MTFIQPRFRQNLQSYCIFRFTQVSGWVERRLYDGKNDIYRFFEARHKIYQNDTR